MKRTIFGVVAMSALAVAVAGAAVGQNPRAREGTGPGTPRANGYGQGYRANGTPTPNVNQTPRYAQGYGRGYGQGRGAGGGWWNRVNPKTPEQKALVNQVSELHSRIRTANWDLRTLTAQNAPAAQVQAKQQEVASLRNQLQQLTAANQALLQAMGVPAGYGVCDGSGPRGGQGYGRRGGMGLGPRDGSGPNPNCPLKVR